MNNCAACGGSLTPGTTGSCMCVGGPAQRPEIARLRKERDSFRACMLEAQEGHRAAERERDELQKRVEMLESPAAMGGLALKQGVVIARLRKERDEARRRLGGAFQELSDLRLDVGAADDELTEARALLRGRGRPEYRWALAELIRERFANRPEEYFDDLELQDLMEQAARAFLGDDHDA